MTKENKGKKEKKELEVVYDPLVEPSMASKTLRKMAEDKTLGERAMAEVEAEEEKGPDFKVPTPHEPT